MKVFKFGGASVKNAEAVENVARIIKMYPKQDLVVVISAMGKMTNALELLIHDYVNGLPEMATHLSDIENYHRKIISDLAIPGGEISRPVEELLAALKRRLEMPPSDNYDYDYDQIVGFGELISTAIVSAYIQAGGLENDWVDARTLIRTDNTYRESRVKWEKTESLISNKWAQLKEKKTKSGRTIMLTQGFIGHTDERNTTTLGREGSDFSAAIFAYALGAESVTIWKDVPGMLNADPKYFSDAVMLKRISYREAIELAYYGATVIHPKTIKPLQNKQIPLFVKSFIHPEEKGTVIESSTFSDSLIPSYIFKVNQILISITPRDFSFIAEDNLSELFTFFAKANVKINLMQNSAINFSVCIDFDQAKLDSILKACYEKYEVLYNKPCELVTIRHYDQETISRLLIGKKVLVEQRSRSTARMVLVNAS
jgi:aspartate kinase